MINPESIQSSQLTQSFKATDNTLLRLQQEYRSPEGQEHKRLKEVAQEFEGIFLKQLLDVMDRTVDRENSILNGGQGEKTFRGMLNQEIATSSSKGPRGSGLGLAESIYQQMAMRMQSERPSIEQMPSTQLKMGAPTQSTDSLKPAAPVVDVEG